MRGARRGRIASLCWTLTQLHHREVAEAGQILSNSGVQFEREIQSKGRSFRVSAVVSNLETEFQFR